MNFEHQGSRKRHSPRVGKEFSGQIGTNFGVGLAGMRERVRELGGELDIQSKAPGPLISVTMPVPGAAQAADASAAAWQLSSGSRFRGEAVPPPHLQRS